MNSQFIAVQAVFLRVVITLSTLLQQVKTLCVFFILVFSEDLKERDHLKDKGLHFMIVENRS